jgi:hypothetical protein
MFVSPERQSLMAQSQKSSSDARLSDSLAQELERVLADARTTNEVWQALQRVGPVGPKDSPLTSMLRNALKTELARREEGDAARIYALVDEALLTGDLRPFWEAREAFASTSPDLTGRLFPHEPDDDENGLARDPQIPDEDYAAARRVIREHIATIEETTPTGSMIEALAVLEDAIAREAPEQREPLRYALELERRRQARTTRNLLRTRLALSLTPGRSYEHFLANRVAYADLPPVDRARLFTRS